MDKRLTPLEGCFAGTLREYEPQYQGAAPDSSPICTIKWFPKQLVATGVPGARRVEDAKYFEEVF